MDSPKVPAGSPRVSAGKLPPASSAIHKLQSPRVIEKSQRGVETSFVKDLSGGGDGGGDVERFNTTESDEDIVKACGQMEDEVVTVEIYLKYK